jgi:DNA invertase Pin-like site-specific DNA recombinase
MSQTVRVGVYARKSTPRQEDSIERQLAGVLPYCVRKGYAVVGEPYVDEGIAGDVFDRRPAFQKLLADAKAGLFSVIVVDEWSRLSRQEPIEFIAKVVKPLKDAGVTLDCVAEGPQRWDDLAQLVLMVVRAEKSQAESVIRSYRTLTGMKRAADEGRLLGGKLYGYTVEYETIQEEGRPPKTRPVRLVPDPRRAHVVRWMFETYAEGGWSMDDIARELNARAVPPPAGKGGRATGARKRGEPCACWTRNTVRAILKNPRYTGALTWNRRSRGKYHALQGGKVEKRPGRDVANGREEWIIRPETHEPLISQDLFERAQERLRANKGHKPSVGAYLFSELVTCSHCGRRLAGITQKGKRRYRCHRYDTAGNVVCAYNAVGEEWLRDRVLIVLQEEMLAPEHLAELESEAARQDEQERAPVALDPLRKRLAELEANIARGNDNLLLLPADRIPGAVARLREWEKERDGVRIELSRRQEGGHLRGLQGAVATCKELLWRLREALEEGDDLLLRQIFREALARIDLRWERRGYGTKTRYVVVGGVIDLRLEGDAQRNTGSRAAAAPAARCPPRRSAAAPR